MAETEQIASDKLKLENVPLPDADLYEALGPFALTFDGYQNGRRSIDECFRVRERVELQGYEVAEMDDLRTALFICQRAIRANDPLPADSGWETTMRKAVAEIRRRLSVGGF